LHIVNSQNTADSWRAFVNLPIYIRVTRYAVAVKKVKSSAWRQKVYIRLILGAFQRSGVRRENFQVSVRLPAAVVLEEGNLLRLINTFCHFIELDFIFLA